MRLTEIKSFAGGFPFKAKNKETGLVAEFIEEDALFEDLYWTKQGGYIAFLDQWSFVPSLKLVHTTNEKEYACSR